MARGVTVTLTPGCPLMVWPVGNGYRIRAATPKEYSDVRDGGVVFPTPLSLMGYLAEHFDIAAIRPVTT